ncbi:MAG: cohesin domain-containing protein [Patescibacteria group bacterium]
MIKISKLKIILLLCSLLFTAISAQAVEISIDSENQTIDVGEQFEAGLFLNTEDEDINAIEGAITFPTDLLELKEIKSGNSIINFWIEEPKITSENRVVFSGIIPGGFQEKRGLIFSMIFEARTEGNSVIEIQSIRALRNDGQGTETKTTVANLQFVILKQAPPFKLAPAEKKDIDIPETFEPIVANDPTIFDGKYFLVFTTQDKLSGIDYYQVKERSQLLLFRLFAPDWRRAPSPYLLRDQSLKSEIYVKAVDKAGNERIVKLAPENKISWYQDYSLWFIIILSVSAALYSIDKPIYGRRRQAADK